MRRFPETKCETLEDIYQKTDRFLDAVQDSSYRELKYALRVCSGEIFGIGGRDRRLIEEILAYRQFVSQHLHNAQVTLDQTIEDTLREMRVLDGTKVKDTIAFYAEGDRLPVAKLVMPPIVDLSDLDYTQEDVVFVQELDDTSEGYVEKGDVEVIYMSGDENIHLRNGKAMRDKCGIEELFVVRVGKAYYLPEGTVVLARPKLNWAEKMTRIMCAQKRGKKKGYRDIRGTAILDNGDRSVEDFFVERLDLRLRKPYRNEERERPVNHYSLRRGEIPLELLSMSRDTFWRMENGDLSHERYFKPGIERGIARLAIRYPEVAKAWIALDKTCDPRYTTPENVHVPFNQP